MNLTEQIRTWQREAQAIRPPSGSDRLCALGGLPGPAFFPEGLGVSDRESADLHAPSIMAVGHNFGCEDSRRRIESAGREDDQATWRNLDGLLRGAGTTPDDCYRTNWFVGLLPGEKQTGRFLLEADSRYETECRSLLLKQLSVLRPRLLLLLGPEVASRVFALIPALNPWKYASRWIDIDQSSIGHSLRNAEIPMLEHRLNVAALLHPSFGAANQSRRMKNMIDPLTEIEIIRAMLL